jgi:outer membrane protein TolC
MVVFRSIWLGFLVGWLGFTGNEAHAQTSHTAWSAGDSTGASAWPSEERAWVRKVLEGNRDLARQRLTRRAAGVDVRLAVKAMRPMWTLEATAEAAPDAKGPATLNLGNANVTLGPGEDRYASQASLGLKQALPTGGEIGARVEGGMRRPEGGAWQDTQAVALDIRQPILRGSGSQSEAQAGLAMAKNEDALAEAELRAQLLAAIFQARSGYWNLLLQARRMKSLLADSAYWEQSLRAAEARQKLGDLAEDEYLRYRIQALDARQNLLEGRLAYRSKAAELLLLLGDSGDSASRKETGITPGGDSAWSGLGLRFIDSSETEPPPPAPVEEKILRARHPTWLRLAHLRQRIDLQVQRARDAEKPQLDLQASWRKPLGGRSDARVGATFAWTLPALSASRDLQKALLQAEAQKLDSVQTLALLRTTLARLNDTFATQRERFRMAEEKSGLEAKRSRIAERRHALGDIDFTELQLSVRDRLQAEQDAASAYVALRLLNAEMEEWNGRALTGSGVILEGVQP